MGIEQASCLAPNVSGKDSEIYKNNKGINKKPIQQFASSIQNRNELLNSYQSTDNINSSSRKCNIMNSPSLFKDIDKIILIQKFIRFYLLNKKFNDRIELLYNIIALDSPVNLVKDKNTEMEILLNNKGEQLSKKLLSSKKIIPYEETLYYRKTIKYYKPNKYLVYTPLIYIDKYKNSNLYKGTWTLEKIFHGYGIFYVSGNKYEGFWHFGKLTGECRYFLQNNDYFIGNFKDGQAEGNGKYYHNDGTIYEGEWMNDQPSGKGKEIFMDGSMFDGIFENGVKKKGIFKWNDGSYYEGEIKNNVFDGYGKFHWKEGREYQGGWVGGKMCGEGVMQYLDGARYEGNFMNGKREGFGKYIWNEKKYYKGEWIKGKQNGKGYFFNKGKGIYAVWKDGNIISYLKNDNKSSHCSHNNSSTNNNSSNNISNINNISRLLSPSMYENSVLSVNQSNNSGIDKIFFKIKTTSNRYKNINSKMNDITRKKLNEINMNNRLSNYKRKNNLKPKERDNGKENLKNKNHSNNTSNINNSNKIINKIQNSNNSLIGSKEKASSRRKNEKLDQTQDSSSTNKIKINIKKK